jgi:uncharacterized protein DUF3563
VSAKSLFNERFGMLMACASPGSAWAYHLGKATAKRGLVQRRREAENAAAGTTQAYSLTGWWHSFWDSLEAWSWDRQVKAQEAYLSQATDLCDLEARMRRLDNSDGLSRSHALR